MKNKIYWNLELGIKPGRYDDLKGLVSEMTDHTEKNEPGTLHYEWTVNPDETECHIYERYTDSDAVMAHLGGFQEHFAGRFLDILEVKRFHVYGNPNDQVREALSTLGAVFMEPVGGFSR